MLMGSYRVSMLFATTVSTLAVFAQSSTGQTPVTRNVSPDGLRPVRIEAYMAEFETVNVQTLANGTTITTETREVRARDSQGRILSITTRTPPAAGIETTHGSINNPVDNTSISWNAHSKKATIMKLPPSDQRYGCWTSDSGHMTINYGNRATMQAGTTRQGLIVGGESTLVESVGRVTEYEQQHEDLGTTTIQGLEAKGDRWTTVVPAGKAGNDNPITTTREMWRSPGFPFALREVYDDPRTGKRTRATVSLTIGEPDASLFQPPEGYEVVTEEMHEIPCQQ
jgi:hypothetical protein